MKKVILLCFLGALFPLSVFCQNQGFNALTKQSIYYFEQNKLEEFEEAYSQLYIEYLKENIAEYCEAVSATHAGDIDNAFSNINNLIDEGLFLDELGEDQNFEILHNEVQWRTAVDKIREIKSSYNEDIRLKLKEIQNRDQGIRLLYLNIENDSLKTAIHEYMKTVVDKDCSEEVCSILDKYGWLGVDEISSEANETLFLGIQHVDDLKVQEKYLPMLKEAVNSGKAEGWHFAFLTDRILMNQGKKQIYGTQKIISKDPAKSFIVPLEYPDKVDILRNELGLSSLTEELADEGIHWNLGEYNANLSKTEELYREYCEKR
ncbi:DUF6624 domain-containing protein [Proteiniphilum sp.]|uniref:DUF6624 domain-containing protein n=1 Tax=Proteiniphilum sp. TaxID=1926877 RepID=UPI00332A2378